MLTLCIDTAYKYLSLALVEDDQIIASYDEECFKRQSEEVFVALNKILEDSHKKVLDIDSICISKGPGSYTGVRIAMTIAKTIATVKNLDLYTISTLNLYAANEANTLVLLDARANRAYCGFYNESEALKEDAVLLVEEIDPSGFNVVGDGSLIGLENKMPKISEAFLKTKKAWIKEADIAHLVPVYLKESDSYGK